MKLETDVGVYMYVYLIVKCIKDYLQNNIETYKEIAHKEFGVSLKNGERIKRNNV